MYSVSVKNLYIGKSKVNFRIQGTIYGLKLQSPPILDKVNLIGEVLVPYPQKKPDRDPDYYLMNGLWNDETKTFMINPVGTYTHTLWVTGVPLNSDLSIYALEHTLYRSYFQDDHRGYLFQITEDNKLEFITDINQLKYGSTRIYPEILDE